MSDTGFHLQTCVKKVNQNRNTPDHTPESSLHLSHSLHLKLKKQTGADVHNFSWIMRTFKKCNTLPHRKGAVERQRWVIIQTFFESCSVAELSIKS